MLGFDRALCGCGDLGRIGLGAGTSVGDDVGRFRTGVVANLGGVHTGGAQLGLILGLGLVGVLPSLLRLGDVALNLGGALVEDRIELRHEELVEEHRNDDKNDQRPYDVINLRNEQVNPACCLCHQALLSVMDIIGFRLLICADQMIRAATKPISASTSTRARPMNMMVWILPDISG